MDIKENFYAKLEQLREDYDPRAKEDKRKNDKYIKRRNKHGLKSGDWNEKSKLINKKAVTGLDEEQLNDLRGKSSLSDDRKKKLKGRIYKKHGKAWDDTIDIRKEKNSSGPADTRDMDKLRNRLATLYNKLEESKQINEMSPGKANDAYHSAMDKLSTADIMAGVTKGNIKKKWLERVKKRHAQAVKFADYADKKK